MCRDREGFSLRRVHYDSCIYIRSKNICCYAGGLHPVFHLRNNILMYIYVASVFSLFFSLPFYLFTYFYFYFTLYFKKTFFFFPLALTISSVSLSSTSQSGAFYQKDFFFFLFFTLSFLSQCGCPLPIVFATFSVFYSAPLNSSKLPPYFFIFIILLVFS